VLDSLEKEYKREEDFCTLLATSSGGEVTNATGTDVAATVTGAGATSPVGPPPPGDKVSQLSSQCNKHQEQKEAFLKACTHARHTARNFLKICSRVGYPYQYEVSPEARVKGEQQFTTTKRDLNPAASPAVGA
jgi:hypothetical protein